MSNQPDRKDRAVENPTRVDDGPQEMSPGAHDVPVSVVPSEDAGRFRAIAEHARDAIIEIAPDARLLYVSPSFSEIFGWSQQEVLRTNGLELVHPEDVAEVEAIRSSAFAEEASTQLVFRLLHADGSWRWVELAGRPYRTGDGEQRAVLIARDVTDRIVAEQALQEQLEAERRIADLSRLFLRVGADDFDFVMTRGLEAAARLAGAKKVQFYVRERAGIGGHYGWSATAGTERRDSGAIGDAATRYPWSAAQVLAGQLLHVPDVALLSDEAADERAQLTARGVGAYLAIPIAREGRILGFLDFFRGEGSGAWSQREIARLELVADVLSSTVERLQAERRRRLAEERFRTLTRHARDTICELSLDGRVLHISDNFVSLCGYRPDELARDPWSLLHPDDVDDIRRRVAEELRDEGDGEPLTYRIFHRDGTTRWLESTMRPFQNENGETHLAVVVRDVTERHGRRLDLERELDLEKRAADFSRALLEQGADAIDAGIQHGLEIAAGLAGADRVFLATTLEGDGSSTSYDWEAPGVAARPGKTGPSEPRRMRWVAAQLARGEIIRVSRVEELPDEDRSARESLIEHGIRSYLLIPILLETKLIGVLGFHCLRQQKEWTDREVTLLRLLADLFTSALRRKRAELSLDESHHRLLQAQKMEAVGTLAGGIAHDFNNQLTVMLANARFALGALEDLGGAGDDVSQALEDLNRAAGHCAQLTRSLLHFSRRTPVSPRSMDVAEVLTDSEELLRPLVPSSIEFTLRRPKEHARVVADPTQIQQVLVNLVVNARDAMPDGGHIWLEAGTRRFSGDEARRLGLSLPLDYVEFAVRDSGHGMDEEVRERIFEPFFTTKPVGQGTGLGLATAYGIVENAGGAILVESEPGHGSKFRVLLPQSPELPAPEPGAAEPALPSATVLLAEDEAGVRRLVARMLRSAGYEVVEAPDGAEALRLGRQRQIDLLVTDIDMPRMSGPELARRLSRRSPQLPVLFISGTNEEDVTVGDAVLRSLVSRFLAKPFSEKALLEVVGDLTPTA